ncbi:hypothetical protein C2E23DRAFT_902485 [Lenzites betulinus]|nr:hypothetical protein C2E23DRAFT_902485 [Lenzites betulinus]
MRNAGSRSHSLPRAEQITPAIWHGPSIVRFLRTHSNARLKYTVVLIQSIIISTPPRPCVGLSSWSTPAVTNQSKNALVANKFYHLEDFTRARQRDRIVEIARGLDFNMKSRVNSCRTLTRLLFVAMIAEGLLTQETFDVIDKDVPLRKLLPEL